MTAFSRPWPERDAVDLHVHSHCSDGTLSPSDLVMRATTNGVRLLGLTDHDETGGVGEAGAVARAVGIELVAGVEVSVTWGAQTIHVLGLRIEPGDERLQAGLARIRAARAARAHEIDRALARHGIRDALVGARRFACNPDVIGRTHFARFLVDSGACADVRAVFRRFLVPGKPGYVPPGWPRLDEAVNWIRSAGGCPIIAHPGRYALSDTQLWALLGGFRDAGGDGVEICCASHHAGQEAQFVAMALALGLRGSQGSDFHDPGESRLDIGMSRPLPSAVDPVWADWRELA